LIWQLNDCWPVVSWSLIDYLGKPKPAYYVVKRCYQPIIAPLFAKGGKIHSYVVNDTPRFMAGRLHFVVEDFGRAEFFNKDKTVAVKPFSSELILEEFDENLQLSNDRFFAVSLEGDGKVLSEDVKTVAEPKDLMLPDPKINLRTWKKGESTFDIEVESKSYAKAVLLEIAGADANFSDEFFDLVPGRSRIVSCNVGKNMTLGEFKKKLAYRAYPYKLQ